MISKRLGIIQPGRIGDIVICLPIARWYADRGYDVIWPVADYVYNNFAGYVDYVNFIPTPDLDCAHAQKILLGRCNHIIDLSITFPNGNAFNDSLYLAPGNNISFDRMKYMFADVPFEEKWNLAFNRNYARESAVYDRYVKAEPYTVTHLQASSEKIEYSPEPGENVVEINTETRSIFDWCKVIEKAQKVYMVDSCMANLVEQARLNENAVKILVEKADRRPPNFTGNWQRI